MKREIYEMIMKYEDNRKAVGTVRWDIKREYGVAGLEEIGKYNGKNIMESIYRYLNDIVDKPKCRICGEHDSRFISVFDGYDIVCCKRCAVINKYGVDNPAKSKSVQDKIKQTNIERYGGPSPLYSTEILEKIKKTNLERYGVEHYSKTGLHMKGYKERTGYSCPLSNPKTRNLINITNINKYGGKSPMADQKIRNKVSKTRTGQIYSCGEGQQGAFYIRMVEYYKNDISFLFSSDDYTGTHIGSVYKRYPFKCIRCGDNFEDFFDSSGIRCPNCDKTSQSKPQDDIVSWLVSQGVKCDVNTRSIIAPLELDIYIPDVQVAIEFDGLYWHSEIGGGKSKQYHLNKTNKCLELGIKLIHIFEDEWITSPDIVKSRILNIIGRIPNKIHARKCNIVQISPKIKKEFLNSNHSQGDCRSSYNVGAYYQGDLVAVMTFGPRRFDSKVGFELIRFAVKRQYGITGIASRLLKLAESEYVTDTLISYCDLRWGSGGLYYNLGFNYVKNSPPNYFYIKTQTRLHRQQFQKHKLLKVLDIFDPNISEWENMKVNGYDRIWDCGNMVFEKTY